MMAANAIDDISLSDDQTAVLIDLWEAHPCLWDPSSKDYKDRNAKLSVRLQIASAMGHGWTEGQIERKLTSLKGYYNTWKRIIKNNGTTGSSGGRRGQWVHYDRIRSFLASTEYEPSGSDIIIQNFASQSSSQSLTAEVDPEEDEASDIELLMSQVSRHSQGCTPRPISAVSHGPSISPSPATASSNTVSPTPSMYKTIPVHPQKRPYISLSSTAKTKPAKKPREDEADPLMDAAMQMSATLSDISSTKQQEHQTYANYVAERLRMLKSRKTIFLVKRGMDKILDDAILAEMSD